MRDSDEDLPIVLSFDFRIFFNSALVSLNLADNEIGDEGAASLAAVLSSR